MDDYEFQRLCDLKIEMYAQMTENSIPNGNPISNSFIRLYELLIINKNSENKFSRAVNFLIIITIKIMRSLQAVRLSSDLLFEYA